ncbi:MAG: threonine/serine dehydratase [bacterium]|nr:threonine/serine dehydratase [bacterium]
MISQSIPTREDLERAKEIVRQHLPPTPLQRVPGLSDLLGCQVWVKYENHLPIGAFKLRGGVHLAATLPVDDRRNGLYTASTGNHGQSIAYAGRLLGIPVTVAVPLGANPTKVAAMRSLGATVELRGRDFDEAREWIQERAQKEGARFVGPTDFELICGVASYALEIFEALPDAEFLLVPVGAGSGASGCCIAAHALARECRVIGVQAESAPTQYLTWKAGEPVSGPMETVAEGIATRVPFANTQRILRDPELGLDDFALVSDAEMEEAIRLLLRHTRNVAEHAGAAPLAAALRRRGELEGRTVVLVLSGGNLDYDELRRIVA